MRHDDLLRRITAHKNKLESVFSNTYMRRNGRSILVAGAKAAQNGVTPHDRS